MFEIFILNEWQNKSFRSAIVPLFKSTICSATNIMFILIICFVYTEGFIQSKQWYGGSHL